MANTKTEALQSLRLWSQETQARQEIEAQEKDLRLDFINRLIFQTDRKFVGGDLASFFQTALNEMAEVETLTFNQSYQNLKPFLTSLIFNLREIREKNQDPLVFIKNFTQFSSVTDPKPAEQFAENCAYSDGRSIQAADPMEREEAADYVEEREQEQLIPLKTDPDQIEPSAPEIYPSRES